MPTDIIERVHTLARRGGDARDLAFTDCSGIPYVDPDDDDSDDESYNPDDDLYVSNNDEDYDADDAPIVGVDHANNEDAEANNEENNEEIDNGIENNDNEEIDNEIENTVNEINVETVNEEDEDIDGEIDQRYRMGLSLMDQQLPRQ